MGKSYHAKGVAVLWTATGISFVSGILYIWSVVSKALVKEFHWTATQASMPYTVATIVFALTMVFGGRLQDIKGPRVCATIGGILLGAGLILSGFAKTPLMMTLTFGVIIGAGIGINNVATTPPSVKWFPPEKKGMITGIVVAGIGCASIFYSPLINWMSKQYGISNSFIFIGLGALVIAVILAQFLSNPPEGITFKKSTQSVKKKAGRFILGKEMKWHDMVKTLDFYKLWIMFAFASSAGLMIIGHAANIAKIQGHWEGGYLLVVLLAIFNTIGRLLGGSVSDYIGRVNLMRLAFILQAVNMAFFRFCLSTDMLAIGVAVAGLCYGATFSVFPATTADFYGIKNLGVNYGLVFTSWGFGGVIGPLTAGKIFDLTGNYNLSYIVSFILLLVAASVTFTFKSSQARDKRIDKSQTA